jgi:hypothetical protein
MINAQARELSDDENDCFRKQQRRRRAILDNDDEEGNVIRLDDGIILRSEEDVNTALGQRKLGFGCSRRIMSLELANMYIHIKRVARKSARQRAFELVDTLYRPWYRDGCFFLPFCQIENKMSYHTYNPQRNGPRLFLETGPKDCSVMKEILIQETFRNTAADLVAKLRKERCSSEGCDYLDFNYFCQVMKEECTGFAQDDLKCLFREPSVPLLVSLVRRTITADSTSTDGAAVAQHSNNNITDRYHSVEYDDDDISEVSNVSEGSWWYPN